MHKGITDDWRRFKELNPDAAAEIMKSIGGTVTPAGEGLADWVVEVSALSQDFVRGFEGRFGYPPDENFVKPAVTRDGELRADLRNAGIPQELLGFYAVVEEISLPDLNNGYFVHGPELVLAAVGGELPTRVRGAVVDDVVVFGSDGGGALFALSGSGCGVYRMTGGSFVARGAAHENGDIAVVAPNLGGFLDFLRDELRTAVAD